MKVFFRVDASIEIGAGHLSRCLTLAHALKLSDVEQCIFILKSHQGDFGHYIKECGYIVEYIPLEFSPDYTSSDYREWVGGSASNDALSTLNCLENHNYEYGDLLVVDHYGLDITFEEILKKNINNICVIDDLVNRKHDCDFLVDQTCGRQESEYRHLLPNKAVVLAGEDYSLLRAEFLGLRAAAMLRRKNFTTIKNVFINFGSTDPTNMTTHIVNLLSKSSYLNRYNLTVVLGRNSPNIDAVKACLAKYSGKVDLVLDAKNMAELIYEADVAIGAAGATTWERCALGLPSVLIKTAENQSTVIDRVIGFGVAVIYDIESNLVELEKKLLHIQSDYKYMSNRCFNLIKADGAKLVAEKLLGSIIK